MDSELFKQMSVASLYATRRMIIEHLKKDASEDDIRVKQAHSQPIQDLVRDLLIDLDNMRALCDSANNDAERAVAIMRKAEEDLAEAKRPFSAQMEMQNRRITGLNGRIDKLEAAIQAEIKWWEEEAVNCNNRDSLARALKRIKALQEVLIV